MVAVLCTCQHCGQQLMRQGSCNCPRATIDWVGAERAAITRRLGYLDNIEALARKKLQIDAK